MFRKGEIVEIPSPVDIHMHLRQPGGETMETIQSGTLAALLGGYQIVVDMPNNPAPHQTWNLAKLEEKIAIARRDAHTNIGFYAGVNLEDPDIDALPDMSATAAGLKLYMGETTGNTKTFELEDARTAIDEWCRLGKLSGDMTPILLHARGYIGAETAQYIAGVKDYPVHWCHIAREDEVIYARTLSKRYPSLFTAGVTPHHLTMTQRNADFQQGWNGARMQPPLGSEIDAEMLLHAYNSSHLHILETDHAPHIHANKMHAEAENPEGKTSSDCVTCYGVSGIEFVLPVMMSLVQRKLTTMERLVDSVYDQPVRMLRLKSDGAESSKTALEIEPRVISEEDVAGRSNNTPYLGWTAWARIQRVMINGVVRLADGVVVEPIQPAKIVRSGVSV